MSDRQIYIDSDLEEVYIDTCMWPRDLLICDLIITLPGSNQIRLAQPYGMIKSMQQFNGTQPSNRQKIFFHIHRWVFPSHEHYVLLWRSSTEKYSPLVSILSFTSLLYMILQKVGK